MPSRFRALTVLLPLCLPLAGCIGFGTNVKGQFTCRAPSGTCAPSRTIDERATRELTAPDADGGFAEARQRAGVIAPAASDDPARTAERRLRVVFPAHIDEAGTLHDEAVAWTVIEAPHWAAQLRGETQASSAPIARQIGRQLKAAQAAASKAAETDTPTVTAPEESPPASAAAPSTSPFELASPPARPSTGGEAIPGEPPPVAEGSDMAATPHDRTPRPSLDAPRYPDPAAIEAAHRAAADARQSPASKEPQP